jgi:hypothetical protein
MKLLPMTALAVIALANPVVAQSTSGSNNSGSNASSRLSSPDSDGSNNAGLTSGTRRDTSSASQPGGTAGTTRDKATPMATTSSKTRGDDGQPAVRTSSDNNTGAAPVSGRNSFTEGEAKSRIESRGYTQISSLRKDEHGVWRGVAMKDGHKTPVALDYQGNVTTANP